MPLVIYSLRGGHTNTHIYTCTHIYMHTYPHESDFKKPGLCGRCAPGLQNKHNDLTLSSSPDQCVGW